MEQVDEGMRCDLRLVLAVHIADICLLLSGHLSGNHSHSRRPENIVDIQNSRHGSA